MPVHTDARTGTTVVMALHLRLAGLLHEPPTPHGLARSTATEVLRLMNQTLVRARTHGADIRFALKLNAIEPLTNRRVRAVKQPSGYTSVATIRTVNAEMPVVGQVALWVARLTGARIGEIFGLLVSDFARDTEGRAWLTITKQGGKSSKVRDEEGRLVTQNSKDGTKTEAGKRTIPIPGLLAELLDRLIEVFHTDPVTGLPQLTNRLIPGVGKEDASGQSSARDWLNDAVKATGVHSFGFHDQRDALITDLKNAGIDERLAHYYAGHEHPDATIQDRHYDLGPNRALLHPVADVMAVILIGEGIADLRVPTTAREQWGTTTRAHERAQEIHEALVEQGWRTDGQESAGGRVLSVKEVAARLEKAETHTRRLMSSGTIRAHQRPWGTRQVWVAYERDVDAYQQTITRPGIEDLATEAGWTYHQVFHLLHELRLLPAEHVKGHQVRLDPDAVAAFRAEAARRCQVLAGAMSLAQAAETLDMPVTSVETLLNRKMLEPTEGPTGARRRWVTVRSVEAYQAQFPTPAAPGPAADEPLLLTTTETRRLLKLTRHEVTRLTSIRQLTLGRKPGNRHVYITADSALAYAHRAHLSAAVTELEAFLRGVPVGRVTTTRRAQPAGTVVDREPGYRMPERFARDDAQADALAAVAISASRADTSTRPTGGSHWSPGHTHCHVVSAPECAHFVSLLRTDEVGATLMSGGAELAP